MKTFLDEFSITLDAASKRLFSLNEAESRLAKSPGKWSAIQIIGHLIDSAANNHQRFVRAQFTEDLTFPGYDQEEWVRVQRYDTANWTEMVHLWYAYNRHIIHTVRQIPESVLLQKRSRHNLHEIAWKTVPENEPATLDYFIRDYVGHLKNHLEQIWSQYKL